MSNVEPPIRRPHPVAVPGSRESILGAALIGKQKMAAAAITKEQRDEIVSNVLAYSQQEGLSPLGQLQAAVRFGAEWQASRKVEAAPSDTDLREQAAKILAAEEWPDLTWEGIKSHSTPERFYKRADAILPLLSRTSQPVQVEVTDDMVTRAYRAHHIAGWGDDLDPEDTGTPSDRSAMRAALSEALGGGE